MLRDVRVRLAGMMFLLYFSLGAWAVTLAAYLLAPVAEGGLNFSPVQVSWTYTTFAIAGMVAPVAIGPLADRWFRADRVVTIGAFASALLLALAAGWCDARAEVIAAATGQAQADAVRVTFFVLFALLLVYCFFLQLSLTLSNVIVHRHHPSGGAGYSHTRMFGTIGWVVVGNLLALTLKPISAQPLWLAAGSAAAFGLFALTLPATPPLSRDAKLLPALRLLKNRAFVVFLVAAFLASLTNQFYAVYIHRTLIDLGVPRPESLMTLGQVVEVGCMFAIPWLHPVRFLKPLMLLGLGGFLLRAVVMYSGDATAIVLVAVPMHGWSFAFFYVVAQTYLKRLATPDIAAGTQALVSFVSGGFGVGVGNLLAGQLIAANRVDGVTDWTAVWATPLAICVATFALFLLAFNPPAVPANEPDPTPDAEADAETGVPARAA